MTTPPTIPNIIQDLATDAFRSPRFAAGEAGAFASHVKDMADGRGCKDGASKCVSGQILNDVRYSPSSFLKSFSTVQESAQTTSESFSATGRSLSPRFPVSTSRFKACPISKYSSKTTERASSCYLSTFSTTDRQAMIADLDAWCEAKFGTDEYKARIKAADSIRNCYEMGAKELNLDVLGLTSLPDSISYLKQLCVLNGSYNNLTTPPDLQNLKQLSNIDLSNNRLTTLPDLQNLKRLANIDLSRNWLSTLPHWSWNFKWLKTLNLSNNSITVLPQSMFALPASCTVDLNHCPLSRATYQALQRRQGAGPCLLLPPNPPRHYDESSLYEIIDELYLLTDKPRPDLPNLFSSMGREHLRYFLHAMRETVHFEQGGDLQVALATLIINYLELAEQSEEYRNIFFPMIEEAKTTCGDKIVLYAIYLGVQKKLLEADLTDLAGLARLLTRGVWALDQLRHIAEDKIAILRFANPEYEEEVQVYLGYPVFLKERLQLPIDLGNMRFLCDVSESDVNDAYKLVSNTLEDLDLRDEFLVLDRLWRTALETTYPEEFATAMESEDAIKSLASLTRKILKNSNCQ